LPIRELFDAPVRLISTKGVLGKVGKEKMGTGNTLKIITITLLVVALMSATAFAAVGKPSVESEVPAITQE
jgi:hypothetical protein